MRSDLIPRVEPTFVAGKAVVSAQDPYEFEPNPNSIDKFLLSSVSAALQAGLLESIRFVQEFGVAEIERRNIDLAGSLKDALKSIPGVNVISPTERESSTGLFPFRSTALTPK